MKNVAMPGLIKIGRSSQDPSIHRVKELSSSTSIPTPFTVCFQALVTDEVEIEKELHLHFHELRYGKEYFKDLSPEAVAIETQKLTTILHEERFDLSEAVSSGIKASVEAEGKYKAQLDDEKNQFKNFRKNLTQSRLQERELKQLLESKAKFRALEKARIDAFGSVNSTIHPPVNLSSVDENGIYARVYSDSIYAGELHLGLPHGHGSSKMVNGDWYSGTFLKGERSGLGRIDLGSGGYYAGHWSDGEPNGWGIRGVENRIHFAGEFIEGKEHGFGKLYEKDNIVYCGFFEHGKRNGLGWGYSVVEQQPVLGFWDDRTVSNSFDIEHLTGIEQSNFIELREKFLDFIVREKQHATTPTH